MRAIQMTETGGPEVMALRELPTPAPGPGQASARTEARGVNFIDVYQREGRYPVQLPFIPGQEAAGTIASLGPADPGAAVFGLKVGDRVAWANILGSYAEFAVVPLSRLIAVPEGVTTRQAAAVMLQGMTAHYLAYATYPIQPGDTVLIHAGAGGVGLLLIQMAKRLGARVFATVSNEKKAELARAAGADQPILYTREDFAASVRELTGGRGLPVVYDSVGKTTFEGSLACLRPRGMMALFGGSSGAVPPFDLIQLSTKGSLYVTRPTLKDYTATREELAWRAGDVLRWVAEGSLKLRLEYSYQPPTPDPAYASLEALGRHVLSAAGGYMTWMCEVLALPDPGIRHAPDQAAIVGDAEDYMEHVLERWRAPLIEASDDILETPEYPTRWKTRYCIDSMLEHAVMHPIRHAFQLDELLKN